MTPAKKTTTKSTTKRTTTKAFSDAERHAMKERAKEAKSGKAKDADQEDELLAKIAEMSASDQTMAKRLHTIVKDTTDLTSKTWYGMPAYAKEGKTICFFQPAAKFKTRYATLGFSNDAQLDDGNMWPNAYALTKIGAAEEKKIVALLKKATS